MTPIAEPFWPAPRRLRLYLEDGRITPNAFAILTYFGVSGAERDGVAVTYAGLAALFDVTPRTIARNLERLREHDLVEYDLRPGQRTPFRVALGPAARSSTYDTTSDTRTGEQLDLGHDLGHCPPGVMSEVLSQVTSDTTSSDERRKAASANGATYDTTSDTSRARAETETETENDDVVVVNEDLGHLLDDLGPFTPGQREAIERAAAEDRAGVLLCIEDARRGKRPAALLVDLVARRAHAGRRRVLEEEPDLEPLTREQQLERFLAGRARLFATDDDLRAVLEAVPFGLAGGDLAAAVRRVRGAPEDVPAEPAPGEATP